MSEGHSAERPTAKKFISLALLARFNQNKIWTKNIVERFLLRTREDTFLFGKALGRLLESGDIIALIGDLGAGKTTLTQAIAQGMGIAEPVTSPTFTLVQEYGSDKNGTGTALFHFDPYRLENAEDVHDFGFEEYLEREGVMVIEWADKIASLLPSARLTLTLREENITRDALSADTHGANYFEVDDTARTIEIEAAGASCEQIVKQLSERPEIKNLRISE